MTVVDKTALFTSRLTEEDVEVPGIGTVRVRALSRAEVLGFQKRTADGAAEMDRILLAAGLVDPALTEDEVKQWQEAATAGEIEVVTRVISRLSGLDEKASKEAVKRFRS